MRNLRFKLGFVWFGLAWLGLASLGLASLTLLWLGLAWLRLAWLRLAWILFAWLRFAWLRLASLRFAWLGFASLGFASLRFASLRFASLGFASLRLTNCNSARSSDTDHFTCTPYQLMCPVFLSSLRNVGSLICTICSREGILKYSPYQGTLSVSRINIRSATCWLINFQRNVSGT